MEKNTIIAVVLSVIVISVGFIFQNQYAPQVETVPQVQVDNTVADVVSDSGSETDSVSVSSNTTASGLSNSQVASVSYEDLVLSNYIIETDLLKITFSNEGGVVTSFLLKDHLDQDTPVEMVYENSDDTNFFEIYFGGPDIEPLSELFNFRRVDANTIEFYRDYLLPSTESEEMIPFTLTKKYTFVPDEYLFTLEIGIENSVNEYIGLDNNGISYTLGVGSQIGPTYKKLDGRYAYRKFYSFSGNKMKTEKLKDGFASNSNMLQWAAISGKYFSVVGIPDNSNYTTSWSTLPEADEDYASMYFSRPLIRSSSNIDTFKFYIGPRTGKYLDIYDNMNDNSWGFSGMQLGEIVDSGGILGWLEIALRFVMEMFYKLVHNYGVAIILLTLTIKVILFPLTHKSYESSAQLQKLQPQIKELQAKYANDKEKLNQKMAALYKKSGVNPMGGCLPMLIQMPILFAFYGLLNKYFELRGATFLAPWIMDLSGPESILALPFTIPLLGWTDLRLLPFLMLGTQLLSTKMTQTPEQAGSNSQMKMFTLLMPIMFFFMLYNMPSGLLLYWTISNAFTVVQQKIITYRIKGKEVK